MKGIIPLQDIRGELPGGNLEFDELIDGARGVKIMPMFALRIRGIAIEADIMAFGGIARRRAIRVAVHD